MGDQGGYCWQQWFGLAQGAGGRVGAANQPAVDAHAVEAVLTREGTQLIMLFKAAQTDGTLLGLVVCGPSCGLVGALVGAPLLT